jgi:hypothetical protein
MTSVSEIILSFRFFSNDYNGICFKRQVYLHVSGELFKNFQMFHSQFFQETCLQAPECFRTNVYQLCKVSGDMIYQFRKVSEDMFTSSCSFKETCLPAHECSGDMFTSS